jgi:hypothetical protein
MLGKTSRSSRLSGAEQDGVDGRNELPAMAFSNYWNRIMRESLMSLRFRLIGLICVILLASLAFSGMIACVSASRSVRIEMHAALQVARQTVASTIDRLQSAADPSRNLRDLVASFEGNRHLRVWLVGEAATAAAKPWKVRPLAACHCGSPELSA